MEREATFFPNKQNEKRKKVDICFLVNIPKRLNTTLPFSPPCSHHVDAEVQVAPPAGLRPKQRLCWNIHGLVPLPLLLRLQVTCSWMI